VATEHEFERWYVLKSADAMALTSWTTEQIVDAYNRGALKDRTVIYNIHSNRRQGMTVKELVDLQTKK